MVPQLGRVVGEYGVTVYSSGGFDSLTVKYDAASRIAAREVPTVVLHVGDHDPSGLALFYAVAEDVAAFAGRLDVEASPSSGPPSRPSKSPATRSRPRRPRRRTNAPHGRTATAPSRPRRCRRTCSPRKSGRPWKRSSTWTPSLRRGRTEAANREAIDDMLRGLRGDEPEEDE